MGLSLITYSYVYDFLKYTGRPTAHFAYIYVIFYVFYYKYV